MNKKGTLSDKFRHTFVRRKVEKGVIFDFWTCAVTKPWNVLHATVFKKSFRFEFVSWIGKKKNNMFCHPSGVWWITANFNKKAKLLLEFDDCKEIVIFFLLVWKVLLFSIQAKNNIFFLFFNWIDNAVNSRH